METIRGADMMHRETEDRHEEHMQKYGEGPQDVVLFLFHKNEIRNYEKAEKVVTLGHSSFFKGVFSICKLISFMV